MIAVLVGAVVALAALIWWQQSQTRAVLSTITEVQPRPIPATPDPWDDIGRLNVEQQAIRRYVDEQVATLTKAVADGIDHVDRNEKRVRGILTGAKRRFDAEGFDDPGVDAEIETLPQLDADGEPEEFVQPVSEDLAEARRAWNGVPGLIK